MNEPSENEDGDYDESLDLEGLRAERLDNMANWEDWCPDCFMHRDLCTCHDYIEREDDD